MKKLSTLFIGFSILAGCSQSEDTPAPPEPAAIEKNSKPTVDVGFAISYANNWLAKPNLDDVEKVKKFLEEAIAVRPEEVKSVLSQVIEIENGLKHEFLFAQAEELIQDEKYDDAVAKLGEYIKGKKSKQVEEAKAHLKLLTYYRSPESAKEFMETFSREQLESLSENPAIWNTLDMNIAPIKDFPPSLADGWDQLCKEQVPEATKSVIELDRKRKQEDRVALFEKVLAIKPNIKIVSNHTGSLALETKRYKFLVAKYKRDINAVGVRARKAADEIADEIADELADIERFCLKNFSPAFATKGHMLPFSTADQALYKKLGISLSEKDQFSRLVVLQLEKDEDLFSENEENQIDILCSIAPDLKQFQIAALYTRLPFGYQSRVTGNYARTIGELLDADYDYKKREKKYVNLPPQVDLLEEVQKSFTYIDVKNGATISSPFLLHLRLSDIPGWIVDESRLDLRADLSSGDARILKIHVSSENDVLVDLLCHPTHSGTLTLQWTDINGDENMKGTAESTIDLMALKWFSLLGSKGIAEIISWGNKTRVSSRIAKLTASKEDQFLTFKITSPIPILGFLQLQGTVNESFNGDGSIDFKNSLSESLYHFYKKSHLEKLPVFDYRSFASGEISMNNKQWAKFTDDGSSVFKGPASKLLRNNKPKEFFLRIKVPKDKWFVLGRELEKKLRRKPLFAFYPFLVEEDAPSGNK